MFLFDQIIFEEIRNFSPSVILFNYGDIYNLKENHFNYLIQNLTDIADHRIILFPDFINLFDDATQNS